MRKETIGSCELYLGDCREVLPGLDGVEAIVSDPPFGISYKSGYATEALWIGGFRIAGDDCLGARDFVVEWAGGRPCLLFGSWKQERPAATRQVLIWDKGGALGMGALDIPWKPDHEEIYVLGKGFIGTRDSGSVLKFSPVQSMAKNGRVHPNEKPVALMEELCRKVPGTILDPFMGSGTTLVACANLGRHGIGIEIDPKYFDITCRRVEAAYRQPRLFAEPVPKPEQDTLL